MGICTTALKPLPIIILSLQIKFLLPTDLPYKNIHLYKISTSKGLSICIIGLDLIMFAHIKCDQIIISYT